MMLCCEKPPRGAEKLTLVISVGSGRRRWVVRWVWGAGGAYQSSELHGGDPYQDW